MTTMTHRVWIKVLLVPATATVLALGGCSKEPEAPAPQPQDTAAPIAQETESVSILRPEIEPPETDPLPFESEPYQAMIGFPEGGSALGEAALAALEAALASPQMDLDLPITLRAHSDSSGSDRVNLNASEARGLAVAKWFIDNGVDADRITVIAFGEQNPIQPNALRDGSPSDGGRAANRRVEIEIATPVSAATEGVNPEPSVEAGD